MQNMQELLDHARSPAAIYDPIPNPWKWNYEEDRWSAIADDGGLWVSDEDEITAIQVGWP